MIVKNMEKKVLLATLFSVMALLVTSHSYSKKSNLEDFVLENVEALATNELGSGHCLGSGSVDCPMGHVKVKYVLSGYSLEGFN